MNSADKRATLLLFGTEGCHLCEQAQQILSATDTYFVIRDIMDNPEWQTEYGVRIPVLEHANGQQLNWPFSEEQVLRFIQQNPIF